MQHWKAKFLLLWSGQAVSLLTSSILQMAIVWYLTQETGSAAVLTTATLVGFLPQAILGTFIGVFIDRHDRKRIMILADLCIALLGLILAASSLFGQIPIWLIMVVLCLRSVGSAFHFPALQAVTPSIVPKDELMRYSGYAQSFESLSMIISPAISAILFSIWNLNAIILLDVAGALLAVLAFCFVKIDKVDHTAKTSENPHLLRETLDGLRILRQTKGMTALIIIDATYALVYFPIGTLYPLITMNYFGGGVAESGTVEVIFSIGSLLGSLLLGWFGNRISKMGTISKSIAIYGIGLIFTGMLPPSGLQIFMILSIVMGITVPLYHGTQTAILQIKIREDYLGRIFSLSSSVSMITMPFGLVVSGLFADKIGLQNLFFAAGIFTVILATMTILLPSLRHCCDNEMNHPTSPC